MSKTEEKISTSVKRCLSLFTSALTPFGDEPAHDTGTELDHQRNRLKIWSANIGAHESGTSYLEYKLRDASNIRRNVLELLHDLGQLLEDYTAISKGEVTPWDKLPDDGDEVVEDEAPETELQQITHHCKDIVDNLLGLSTAIKNQAPHDQIMAAKETGVSFYEQHDINYVRESYSALLPWQVERLGKAISRRRQYFRYRRTRHEQLTFDEPETEVEKKSTSTLASSIPDELKPQGLREEKEEEQEYISQTSFVTSTSQGDARRIPPLPDKAEAGPFECPFCYCIIVAHNRQEWK